ncbi:MAG TPA: hypothetical protein VG077_07730, partial [Verrucomicrobiae bacterium]|nr:hypothetical protein [Verrucomicrobiae bacterium]
MKALKNRAIITEAVLLFTLMLGLTLASHAQFVHPGCLGSQADLNRARTEVAAGVSPWIDDWNRLTNNSHAQLSYVDHPQSVVYRGVSGSCPAQNYTYLYNDAAAIWACALRYQISGDTNYANKAVQIMNDWSA